MDTDNHHPGMPPPNMANGEPATYGYTHAAAQDWTTHLSQHAGAWEAINQISDPALLNTSFGSIELRNALMLSLGLPREPVGLICWEDSSNTQRTKTVGAIRAFAASEKPDPKQFDGPNPPFRLNDVLAVMDAGNLSCCQSAIVPVLTLLVLRHCGMGDRYDAAVLAKYAPAFTHMHQQATKGNEDQYAATQAARHTFLKDSAERQVIYRELNSGRKPANEHHLPAPVSGALARLRDAYRLDMTLAQRTEVVKALETFTGVSAESSPDTTQVLDQLLSWYEDPRPGASPPPLSQLMGLVNAVGWCDYQDDESLRKGTFVKHSLTGHPALPDAMSDAISFYLPANQPSLAIMPVQAPLSPAADDPALPPLAARFKALLQAAPNAGPRRIAQLMELAIAQNGAPLVERIKTDVLAEAQLTTQLRLGAADDAQRATIGVAMRSLTELMRNVVSTALPLQQAFLLDLYRSLGVAASALTRAGRLNRLFVNHPEISPKKALELTERFAESMLKHGYSQTQCDDLRATARQLCPHWESLAPTRNRIEKLHDKALDTVLETEIARAGTQHGSELLRLGTTAPMPILKGLVSQYAFTNAMLRKLLKDLDHYFLHANVADRQRIEGLYRPLLNPPGGAMTGVPMAQAINRLRGAITRHLAEAPASITQDVAATLAPLADPTLPVSDLYQLLRYFWRVDSNLPKESPLNGICETLDTLKQAHCVSASGAFHIGQVSEFNNAAREKIVSVLSARVPGFGAAYADALETVKDKGYEAVQTAMQTMIIEWAMPAQTY